MDSRVGGVIPAVIVVWSVSVFAPLEVRGGEISPGDIFIVVAAPGRVYRITSGGDFSAADPFATGLSDPYGLAFAPDGADRSG